MNSSDVVDNRLQYLHFQFMYLQRRKSQASKQKEKRTIFLRKTKKLCTLLYFLCAGMLFVVTFLTFRFFLLFKVQGAKEMHDAHEFSLRGGFKN